VLFLFSLVIMSVPVPTPAPGAKFDYPVPIIDRKYCAPHAVDLAIVRKVLNITEGNFVVTDVNGTVIFKVNEKLLSMRGRRVLRDGAGNPVVTIREKLRSARERWKVYRGESAEESDLIFSIKRTAIVQRRIEFSVFLANNTKEDVCDYKVEADLSESSCVVYAGESSSKVAMMEKKKTVKSVLIGKDHFNVMIDPNIDSAFIVALVVILDASLPSHFQTLTKYAKITNTLIEVLPAQF